MQRHLRILFAGSPAIAVPALESVIATCGANALIGLLTNPDSPRGRSGKPEPTECAAVLGQTSLVPILKPERLDAAAREQVAALKPDLLVSFAYGRIFGPRFLELFTMGGINIHPSLLPKSRGPTPIPAAIMNRESRTGITIQRLAAETDSGDILAQETVRLNGRETTESLGRTMATRAAKMLPPLLSQLARGSQWDRPQDHGSASYCSLISKTDGLIDWNMGAPEIDARIRAFTPWPLSWTMHGDSTLLILRARALEPGESGTRSDEGQPGRVLGKDGNKGILIQTGNGILAVSELQYRTKKALEWRAFLNGARNFIGERLG